MTEPDDIEGIAAEYVLGTLDRAERAAVEARLLRDPALRAAIAGWAARLQPLADDAPGITPPPRLFDTILAAVAAPAVAPPTATDIASRPAFADNDNVSALQRALRRWRLSAVGLGAIAAALAAWVVVRPLAFPAQTEFVALLTADGVAPAFVATLDMGDGRLTIRRVGGEPAPATGAYELWAIEPNAPPRSLGLLQNAVYTAPIGLDQAGDVTLAITLEAPGGAPPSGPAGPIVFQGTLIPAAE